MKYCSRNWFTLGSSGCPATDQTLFTRIPTVHLPGCIRATAVGPMPNLPCPRRPVFVAVGRSNCGPTPQVTLLFFGEKKNAGCMSPRPYTPVCTCTGGPGGCGTLTA